LGPILGAISVNAFKSYATKEFAQQWFFILGGLFIVVTLFMPKGIVGIPDQMRALRKKFGRKTTEEITVAAKLNPVEK
jgi:urea transport system permease protein